MAHLTVRDVSRDVIAALQRRATANGRSVEVEHRELLREALLGSGGKFITRAAVLRQRLLSSVDSTETIPVMRDIEP